MALEDFEQEDNSINDDIEEKGYDRLRLFNAKPRSSFIQVFKANNLLVPKTVRKTHDRFHVFYSPMGKTRGCDFNYHTYGRNKQTGIYEHLLSQVIAHEPKESWWGKATQKGDGVIYNLVDYDEPNPIFKIALKLSQLCSFNLYELEYGQVENALYLLNKDNIDYIYELALKLPDDKSIFDHMPRESHTNLVKNSELMALEKKKKTLNAYNVSQEAKEILLKDKDNVLYFTEDQCTSYYLKGIYKSIPSDLFKDAQIALRFMVIGSKEFRLNEVLRHDKDFALQVAKSREIFGRVKTKKNKNNHSNFETHLSKEDFITFFPDFQRHEEIAQALKNTLGEYIPGQAELDKLYQQIMPYCYTNNDVHKLSHLPVVNWKQDYIQCTYEILIWNEDSKVYIKEHEGSFSGAYTHGQSSCKYANYLDNRFRDIEVKCPEIFLNMHDRDYLVKIIKNKVMLDEIKGLTLHELLDISHPNFPDLMNDKQFIIQSGMPLGSVDIKYLSEALQNDKDIALHAIGSISHEYSYNHVTLDDFRNLNTDIEVVEAFCKSSATNFRYAHQSLREDKALTLEMIQKTSPQSLNEDNDGNLYIHKNIWQIKHYTGIYEQCLFKEDKEVALIAVKHFHCLDDIEDKLKNDWDIQAQAVIADPNNYHDTNEDFRYHPDNLALGLQVFEHCAEVYPLLPEQTRANRDIAQDALSRQVLLMHLPENLRDDEEMVLFALTISTSNYQYISQRLKDREDILLLATTGYYVLSRDRHNPYSKIYTSLIDELENLQDRQGYESFNLNIYGKADLIEYASERLQQKFGTTEPYEYLKGEHRAQNLADELERCYGYGDSYNNDMDIAITMESESELDIEYQRPYKI
jgi:hypothetical protein